jgi:hypothetical protein
MPYDLQLALLHTDSFPRVERELLTVETSRLHSNPLRYGMDASRRRLGTGATPLLTAARYTTPTNEALIALPIRLQWATVILSRR